MSSGSSSSAVSTLQADFPMFANLRPPDGAKSSTPALAELNEAMAKAGLSSGGSGISEQWSWGDVGKWAEKAYDTGKKAYDIGKGLGLFSEGPQAQFEAQFLDNFLRAQVEPLIQKLREYVNRYGNLGDCVPLVTQCVQQFANGQYAAALSTGYQAYSCISAKI